MFRFTIRELLILTVTAGLAVGWWVDRSRILAHAKESKIKLLRQIYIARSDLNDQIRMNAVLAGRLYDRRQMASREED